MVLRNVPHRGATELPDHADAFGAITLLVLHHMAVSPGCSGELRVRAQRCDDDEWAEVTADAAVTGNTNGGARISDDE